MTPTRRLAGRSRELRRFEPNGFLRETFHAATLPLHAAFLQARKLSTNIRPAVPRLSSRTGASFPTAKLSSRCDGFRRGMS
jgi:hypothetical protein